MTLSTISSTQIQEVENFCTTNHINHYHFKYKIMYKTINIDKIIFGVMASAMLILAAFYMLSADTTTSSTVMQWQSDSTWTVGW